MSSLSPAAQSRNAGLSGARRTVAIAAVLSAMALAVLDTGMANVALPSLALAFAVTPAQAILVLTAYQAGLIMALLPLGAMGERHGHARIFSLSVAVFAAASLAAACAPGLGWVAVARFVQGLGGAGIMALGMALLRLIVSRDHLGRAIGWNALTVALASAAAPSIGALVLAVANWRWLFAVNLPIVGLALLASRALPATPRGDVAPDAVGMTLSAGMFAMLIVAAQIASTTPRAAAVLLGAALLALGLLVRRELGKPAPLFPFDLLREESLRLSAIASVCCFAAQTAGFVGLPFLLQRHLHQSELMTGLCITAWPLSVAVAATFAGRLADRAPSEGLCAAGAAALSAGLAVCGIASHVAVIVPAIVLAGLGFGLFQSPNNRNLFLSAPAQRTGAAGGLQGTARVSGQTVGALLMAALFGQLGLETALPVGLAAGAALALTAGVVSLLRSFT